jgi:hypothetical protein
VIPEDLYVAGNRITIDGRVEGDVYAAAFEEVRVNGEITGSLVALTSRIVVSGNVGGSVTGAAVDVTVDGTVGGDVFVAAWGVETAEEASVGRDLLVWAWDAAVAGRIGRNVEGQVRSMALDAAVERDVAVTLSSLTVGPVTTVGGDLSYRSVSDADVASGVGIGGSLVHERPLPVNVRIRAIRILVFVVAVAGAATLGLAIIWSAPDRARVAAMTVRSRPLAALGWGIGVAVIPLVLMGLAGLVLGLSPPEAGLPLLAVFLPLVLAALGLLVVGLLLAPVAVSTALGLLALPDRSVYAAFLAGTAAIVVASLVPYLGAVVLALAGAVGMGGWLASVGEQSVRSRP